MSNFHKIKIADFGFVFTIISLIMLIGIGGGVETMPPDASLSAWFFVFIQGVCAVVVGVLGSKMLLEDNADPRN